MKLKTQKFIIWISVIGLVGIIFGVFYSFFGLKGLPVYQKFVPDSVYILWSNGLYGAVFIGFSILLLFVGRHAFRNKNKYLMKVLLFGVMSWLIIEALFSLYYGVYTNVGVDVVLIIFLGLPLLIGIRSKN